jgi:hypothetical protein
MSESNLNQVPMSLGKNMFAAMRFYFENWPSPLGFDAEIWAG